MTGKDIGENICLPVRKYLNIISAALVPCLTKFDRVRDLWII